MITERLQADDAGIQRAAELLLGGEVVAFPTETVYGLGAVASNVVAVRKIFEAKGRPADRPVIVHIRSLEDLTQWAKNVPHDANLIAKDFWPGPLTLVLPRLSHVPDVITGNRETVGLRVPSNPVALELLERVGTGLAAPSANQYGHVSPTTADHVLADLDGRIAGVLDGGPCTVGVESTIVEVLPTAEGDYEATLLRHGGVALCDIEETINRTITDGSAGTGANSRAPGMVASHYSPGAPLRIVSAAESTQPPAGVAVIRPEPQASDADFAERLYADLRAADSASPTEIWVVPPNSGPLLPAILDRLRRAAT